MARFLYRLCQLIFAGGFLSLCLATANELFGLGIWEANGYPSLTHNSQGQELPTGYGTFMWRFALVTLIVAVVGTGLHWYIRHRELSDLAAAFDAMDEDEQAQFIASLQAQDSDYE